MYEAGLNSVFIGSGRMEELSRIIVKSQGQCDRRSVNMNWEGAIDVLELCYLLKCRYSL